MGFWFLKVQIRSVTDIELVVKLEAPSLLIDQAEMGLNASPYMGTSPTNGNMVVNINDLTRIINKVSSTRKSFYNETRPCARLIFDSLLIIGRKTSQSMNWEYV